MAAYDPRLALNGDVFRHVAAYDPRLARDRDVFRHVAAYVHLWRDVSRGLGVSGVAVTVGWVLQPPLTQSLAQL